MTPVHLSSALSAVAPLLTPVLTSEDALPRLFELAADLPPIARGGFECRLGGASSTVDLHQAIWASHREQDLFHEAIRHRSFDDRTDPTHAWTSMQRVAKWWSEEYEGAAADVRAVFLELDHDGAHDGLPVPSLFFKLGETGGVPGDRAHDIVSRLADIAGQPSDIPFRASFFAACTVHSARITHVGMMLSRRTSALRFNVKIEPSRATAFLRSIGWTGDFGLLEDQFRWRADVVDHIVLCLDIDAQVYPHIGLECFVDGAPNTDGRWERFIDVLVDRGLCTPDKRNALLAFHRLLTPTTPGVTWPDALILDDLLAGRDSFGTIACRLHHIKLSTSTTGDISAKGYIGFAYRHLDRTGQPLNPASDGRRISAHLPDAR
jgi:hypothetical protein